MRNVIFCLLVLAPSAFAKEYRDPINEFSLNYDEENWEVVPPRYNEKFDIDRKFAEKTLLTLQRKLANDKYRPRFSVVVDDPKLKQESETQQLREYAKGAVDFLKAQRFTVFSAVATSLPNLPLVYDIRANQRDFGLMFRQIVLLRGGKAYLLTLATRTDKFEESSKETSKMFDSFKFYGKLTR